MAHRTTSLSEVRTCDVCAMAGYSPVRMAVWDSPVVGGRWGYLCTEHGSAYGARHSTLSVRITYPESVKAPWMREYRRLSRQR